VSVKARRAQEAAARTRRFLYLLGGVVVAVLLVVFAVAVGGSGGDGPTEYPVAAVYGESLPLAGQDPLGSDDPAIGVEAPVIEGFDLDGEVVRTSADGRPTIVVLLAHWCPHCRREVPILVDWLDGFAPEGAPRVVGVATSIDPTKPNYSPERWLEREGWPAPVLFDGTEVVPEALGMTGFPFFVVLDGEGRVVRRLSGEIEMGVLDAILADL
jgi:thiol-disulfide isomerase/thioredoxin